MQKRAMSKDSFPGKYDTSSAGHIQAGDEPLASGLRELAEELGIHAKPEDLPAVIEKALADIDGPVQPYRSTR